MKKKNLKTPAFWARYLLWEKDDINKAIEFIEKKMGVDI